MCLMSRKLIESSTVHHRPRKPGSKALSDSDSDHENFTFILPISLIDTQTCEVLLFTPLDPKVSDVFQLFIRPSPILLLYSAVF